LKNLANDLTDVGASLLSNAVPQAILLLAGFEPDLG
jgi:hypothetical protein